MRKKRIMVVGPSRSGKTTIVNYLNNYNGHLKRTVDVIYGENTMDIPSSYIENTDMYKHIIALAQDASKIVIIVDYENPKEVYSDGFGLSFNNEVIGVINKIDNNLNNLEKCKKQLKRIGVKEPYFLIGKNDEVGIKELKEYLLNR